MTFIIISFSIFSILFSGFLFYRVSGSIMPNRINMLTFIFYIYFILMSYIGSIIILLYPDEYFNRIINQIKYEDTKLYVWLALSYMMLAFPLGALLSKIVMKVNNSKTLLNNYIKSEIKPMLSNKDSFIRIPLYILSSISMLAMIYTYYTIGINNFISMFNVESQVKLLIARTEISNSFQGNIFIKNIFGFTFLPILTYVAYSYYQMTKTKKDLIWFLLLFISTFLFLIHDFQKSPFVIFLLGFVFLYILNYKQISWRTIFLLFLIFIGMFVLIYSVVVKNIDVSYMLSPFNEGLTGRILISEISSLYAHFELFPAKENFLGISSLSQFINQIFGLEYSERSGRLVLENYASSWIEQGYGGVFNTIFLGEAWANFGFIGLLLSPIWTGFLIGCLYFMFLKLEKTPLYLGLFIYFSYRTSIAGGFNDYIYNSKLIIMLMIILIIIFFAKELKKMHLQNKIKKGYLN